MGAWGASPSAFVSFALRAGHLRAMFGAGHGKVGREMQTLPGETRNSLERGSEAGGLGGYSHHPMVVTTLALEVALCQSASSSIAQSGGKSWGKAMQGRGVRVRDDLLSQQTLGELQETKPQ